MVRLSKIIVLLALLTFSFPLLDVQAKGGGKGGGGMGKGSGGTMDSGPGMGQSGKNSGNANQQGKGNGQRARDGSCENNDGQGKGSGKKMMNENNKCPQQAHPVDAANEEIIVNNQDKYNYSPVLKKRSEIKWRRDLLLLY